MPLKAEATFGEHLAAKLLLQPPTPRPRVAGSKTKEVAPAFAPAPGLGRTSAAFLLSAHAPAPGSRALKPVKLVSPLSTEHLNITVAAAQAPAPGASQRRNGTAGMRGQHVSAKAALAPAPGAGAPQTGAAHVPAPGPGQAAPAPLRASSGGFASLGKLFG